VIIILMGVVGSGKTTVGSLLASELGWQFADADDFHSAANKEKIHRGIPLGDEDREPWLDSLHNSIAAWSARKQNVVLACSALKRSYRQTLYIGPEVHFVYLKGGASLIAARLRSRKQHFADDRILASQFADLEEPDGAITVDISGTPEQIAAEIRKQLGLA
jgi:gluconokinase